MALYKLLGSTQRSGLSYLRYSRKAFYQSNQVSSSIFKRSQSTHTSDDNDHYLIPKSKVYTYHYQDSLPRLPIPKLEDTCRRYLDSQKPLLTPDDYEITKKYTEKFKSQEGPGLHAELVKVDKMNKHTSYISESWFDMYLRDRSPVVLNYNPFIVFKDDPKNNNQIVRATNFIKSAVRFKKSMDETILEPDVFHLNPKKSDTNWFKNMIRMVPRSLSWYGAFLVKAFPLDMSQYGRLFCSTRIPSKNKDKLATFEGTRHMLVMHKGHLYVFDVITTDGNIVDSGTIYQNLKEIVNDPTPPPDYPVGILTSEERDTWAGLRHAISAIPANHESLKLIDSALFALCLDDNSPTDPIELTKVMLHGDGANRWYDKSFSLIVSKNGTSAINFEHAWGDGVAVLRFFNEVFKDTTTRPAITEETAKSVNSESTVRKLEFSLTSEIERGIRLAQEKFDNAVGKLHTEVMEITSFGKEFIKTKKLSPDALFQLAFQMGIYRQKGHFVPTYESCSTAAFRHGRTETIRPASNATVACCEAFDQSHRAGVDEMVHRIKQASDWHSKLTKEAAMGQGFDRHLFALRMLAESSGANPEIFQDPAYSRINRIYLSTSTLSSPAIILGGFANINTEGLGVGYGIFDERLGANATCFEGGANAREFLDCVQSSLEDLYAVLNGRNFKN